MTNSYEELFVPVPWGKLALITWGQPSSPPVLMMHGRQDSAASFIPLIDVMPLDHYYVGVDLPGHGRSDPFPKGIVLSRLHFIHAIEMAVRHFAWNKFIFLSHSMGCELGLLYNAVYPGLIKRFVFLDAGPALQKLFLPAHRHYHNYYDRYYSNYARYNNPNRLYTKQEAVEAMMKARDLDEEKALVMLSRNMEHVEGDKYRLTWDSRAKYIATLNATYDFYSSVYTTNAPPTLFISMTEGHGNDSLGKEESDRLVKDMLTSNKHSRRVVLKGLHDHHVTNPEEIAKYAVEFLNENLDDVKSKL